MKPRFLTSFRAWSAVLAAVVCTTPISAADVAASRRTLTPDDFYRIQVVEDPQVSPDGEWVAYVVTTNDRESDEQRGAVWMVSWDGSQHIALTAAAKGIRAPRWSPDGRYLAFIGPGADSEPDQIRLLDRRGGDSRALTQVTGDIGDYAWSPDGRRLAFVLEQDDAGKTPKPIVIDALQFKQDGDGYLGAGHAGHVWLLDLESRKIEVLSGDAKFNESLPAWSPDGRRIAFVTTRNKGPDPDGMEEIDVIDARAGSTALKLARAFAPGEQRLAWSPDGTLVAYRRGLEPKFISYMQDRLAVVPVAGGPSRSLSDALDRAVTSYAFAPDGASIAVTVEDDGAAYPARIDLRSGAIQKLATGPYVVSALSVGGNHTAVLFTDDTTAVEVYALEAGKPRKLTTHNDALLAEVQLGAVESLAFRSRDGAQIHGFEVKPPGFVAGRKYPTILWIHGGPNDQDAHAMEFAGNPLARQLLAAAGFVVLGVNYRGSSGRGSAFARAIFADWGHREVEDILAGADYLVARGIADPERLGIGGWSYGGILTDYVIASDRRFKAAFSGAGSANQLSMYGSDEYILVYNNEVGVPWVNTALWIKLSYPFFHADRIHTPTLFMGGDKDVNVPVVGGEQMYQALRTLGVPTQLVVYPGEQHTLTRPSFLKDRAERMIAWFSRFLVPGK